MFIFQLNNGCMFKKNIFCLLVLLVISSCKKEGCESPTIFSITTNEDVYVGWPLRITTENGTSGQVQVYGPNGFKKVFGAGEYKSRTITIDSATYLNSGIYSYEFWEDGCVTEKGSIDVTVLPPPTAPCTMADNTGETTIMTLGGTNYTYTSVWTVADYFGVQSALNSVSGTNVVFNGPGSPAAGKYVTIYGLYYPDREIKNSCTIRVNNNYSSFFALSGQDVYVSYENDKLVVTFCSVEFLSPSNVVDLVVSAKMVVH